MACKTKAALDGGIGVIWCCGESLEERENGTTVDVVTKQLDALNKEIGKNGWGKVVVAYEPIWAIGTGKVATTGKSISLNNKIGIDQPLQSKHRKSTLPSESG